MFFSSWEADHGWGKMDAAMYKDILDDNLLLSTLDSQDKGVALNHSVNVLDQSSQS